MRNAHLAIAVAMIVTAAGAVDHAMAQPPRRGQKRGANGNSAERKPAKAAPLPNDKRLLALHKQFMTDAEKLALEYEQDEEWDRAKAVYQEILKLLPQHVGAAARLKLLRAREANANVQQFTIQANEEWQDTFIDVEEGRPVSIRAGGAWTFNLSIKVGPDGIQIPKELKEYNMGCLIGVIRTPGDSKLQAFVVGKEKKFVAEKSGRLFLRMYDISPLDNEGELAVEVRGTYRSLRNK